MNRQKRILLYGFGPYRQFRENITAKIIKSLSPAAGLERVVFPVRFHRGQFVQALKRHKPEIVLGLGQSARRTIELETRAGNRRRAGKKAKARAIRKDGARWLPTTLNTKLGRRVKRSNSAGDYVCNFSMYIMLDLIEREAVKTQFGFMHIPHNVTLPEAVRAVAGVLKKFGLWSGIAIPKSTPDSKAGAPSPT